MNKKRKKKEIKEKEKKRKKKEKKKKKKKKKTKKKLKWPQMALINDHTPLIKSTFKSTPNPLLNLLRIHF